MNVVDGSAWIEYFTDGPASVSLVGPITRTDILLVPTTSIFEVYRHVLGHVDRAAALRAAAAMRAGTTVDLDHTLALEAAEYSERHDLVFPDAVSYAVARAHNATLWTVEPALAGLEGVRMQGGAAV